MHKPCSIGHLLDNRKGVGPGFDIIRLSLALLVMAYHCAATLRQSEAWNSQPFWMLPSSLLPMFFALSGFLISASATRLGLLQFALNRGLRIMPALIAVVTLTALVIGPLFSNLPPRQYFSDPLLLHYFSNIAGFITYNLPGLFRENEQPGIVNAALWTIPYEVICYALCYVLISVIMMFHASKRPLILAATVILFTIAHDTLDILSLSVTVKHFSMVNWWIFGRGTRLFSCFLMGSLFYGARYYIPFHRYIFAGCLLSLILFSVYINPSATDKYCLTLFLNILITYITVYIGLSNIPKLPVISTGDYSYGTYLCHCPLVNCVYYFTLWNNNVAWLFLFSLPFVGGFAAFSWWFIEKPALRLGKKFSFGERLVNAS